MTIEHRQQQLRAAIRPWSLEKQIETARAERVTIKREPSRKQLAQLRRMILELSDDQLEALEGELDGSAN